MACLSGSGPPTSCLSSACHAADTPTPLVIAVLRLPLEMAATRNKSSHELPLGVAKASHRSLLDIKDGGAENTSYVFATLRAATIWSMETSRHQKSRKEKLAARAEKCSDQQNQLGTIPSDLIEGNRSLFSFIIYHIARLSHFGTLKIDYPILGRSEV